MQDLFVPGWFDSGDLALVATVAWDGTPPSSGTLRYRWLKIGPLVIFNIRGDYSVAGANNTTLTVTKPADMPTPLGLTGWASGEMVNSVMGSLSTAATGAGGSVRAALQHDSTNYVFKVVGSSISAAFFFVTGFYFAAS